MVGTAVDRELVKYKSRVSRARLAYYSLTLSLFLTISSFGSGFSLSSLSALLLILPLPLYFGLQSLKLYHKTRLTPDYSITLLPRDSFSFPQFLTQPNWAFRFSILLFFLVVLTTLARLQVTPSTLTMIP